MRLSSCFSRSKRFAHCIGAKPSEQHPPSTALHTVQFESAHGKKKSAERQTLPDRGATPAPISEPQSMHDMPSAGPLQAAQGANKSKKKRKRLTKAADMLAGAQSMDVEQPASGLRTTLQV